MDRKCALLCKRLARIESFRKNLFVRGQITLPRREEPQPPARSAFQNHNAQGQGTGKVRSPVRGGGHGAPR